MERRQLRRRRDRRQWRRTEIERRKAGIGEEGEIEGNGEEQKWKEGRKAIEKKER